MKQFTKNVFKKQYNSLSTRFELSICFGFRFATKVVNINNKKSSRIYTKSKKSLNIKDNIDDEFSMIDSHMQENLVKPQSNKIKLNDLLDDIAEEAPIEVSPSYLNDGTTKDFIHKPKEAAEESNLLRYFKYFY